MHKFLETKHLTKLSHKVIENLNKISNNKAIKSVTNTSQANKNPGPDYFTGEFHQTLKEKKSSNFQTLSKN